MTPAPSTAELAARADTLLNLHHRQAPVVLPTAWDVWSARFIEEAGFEALTVGSHPLADSLGAADGEAMSLEQALEAIARITAGVDIPVSADLESGYDTPPAELVERTLAAGVVGINIEDVVHSRGAMRSAQEHADYLAGIRQAADQAGVHLVINGRTDVYKHTGDFKDPLSETLHRLHRMEEAGVDSLYPVGLPSEEVLSTILAEIRTPLNVTAHPEQGAVPDGLGLARLTELGVSRVSFGPLLQMTLAEKASGVLDGWK
ncbi:isocitrate lyase/PEP mutase family protein [Nesterenkonia xinjiangensis]|uniref:2-methylisocitrate lyase-like PEP mutase family enzyme n=1 Tax=Nesterenkonia xinjiangensis TaxID=225327 RepID=A0A7Z0GNT8_9MICC|nr:isocitrate lyase/phosphoenolpyruvate mutase family protein [Nesterenkonia xinjiangensis]NYJ79133.1 2-methylisocitrate lyase-like PEP mutase family enzyme [Nesterenkonia xinjiangensis]